MSLDGLFSEQTWALWGLLGTLLGTLLLVAALLWTGARVGEQARALWRSVRGQRAAVKNCMVVAALAARASVTPRQSRYSKAGPTTRISRSRSGGTIAKAWWG